MKQKEHGTLISYTVGFALSIILTLAAFIPVMRFMENGGGQFSQDVLLVFVIVLAFVQMIVQLVFFLHLGQESKPRWQLFFFTATFGVILIVVVGAIWIMNNLNYNMMPEQMEKKLIDKEGIYRQDGSTH